MRKMKRTISTYLYALGVLQLLGMNLGGFFWLAWASGIREGKQSSRRWVIGVHSIYLALFAWGLARWFGDPSQMNYLYFFRHRIEIQPSVMLGVLLLLGFLYGLPVFWLMRKAVKEEFIEHPSGHIFQEVQ
jgi:hypothetical protein